MIYPPPSDPPLVPSLPVPVGTMFAVEGGTIFMWNGADWESVDEEKLHWALLRCTVEEIEKERAREKKVVKFR